MDSPESAADAVVAEYSAQQGIDPSEVFNFLAEHQNEALRHGLSELQYLADRGRSLGSPEQLSRLSQAVTALAQAAVFQSRLDEVVANLDMPRLAAEKENRRQVVAYVKDRSNAVESLRGSLFGLLPILFPGGHSEVAEGLQRNVEDYGRVYDQHLNIP